ncbi:MAG: efflux transporter outer membrane subunit [Ferrovum sp.]|jgi:NodT family efflux transporter outer membrane factor (OMF) lipoprotein|nr:efflux transporter outer membrane subunit [Ferrovum sp.]NDU87190.1 efflux transporter outer membrane subunit [Ferrovum sp.]
MPHTHPYRSLFLGGILLILTGCTLGPDFQRPAAPQSTGYLPQGASVPSTVIAEGTVQRFNARQAIPFDWWTLFHSTALNELIDRAFTNNPTIAAAQAALGQAQALTVAQQGFFFPTVGVNYMPSRNKLAGNMGGNSPGIQGNGQVIQTYSNPAGPIYNGPAYYNFHTAQLMVGFTPDVFGNNRRQVESLKAQEDEQAFQLEATYITLASNVVATAFQEASLRAQIQATEKIIKANQDQLDILHAQERLGYVMGIDVANQETALAQAQQNLPPLEKALAQTRDMLRALAGNLPDQDIPQKFELADLHLPEDLPLSLPSQLVEQRPDIRMAEEQLHAASAQVGVAFTNRLPQFSITGFIGGEASTFDQMFHNGAGFFGIIGDVSQTLFDGGTLGARETAARQALKQAEAQYRSTVITAFQNVADTLHALDADAQSLKAATATAQAAHTAFTLTQKQYDAGYINAQAQLTALINEQQASLSLVQAQVNRFGDTAALYQALGGGWWQRKNGDPHTPVATLTPQK